MLAVGRALMSRPKLMMLDEPSLGLAPLVVQDIFSIIREINRQGMTVLLIEQNANMALKIADLAYVLETGRITMSGTGAELLADEKVKEAYLASTGKAIPYESRRREAVPLSFFRAGAGRDGRGGARSPRRDGSKVFCAVLL